MIQKKISLVSVLWAVLIIAMMSACHGNKGPFGNYQKETLIPIDTALTPGLSTKILTKTELLNVRGMINVNNKYLVVAADRKKGIFKVWRLPDLTFLYTWGQKGKGPGELMRVGFNTTAYNTNKDSLFVYDGSSFRLNEYTVTDTAFVFNRMIPLPHNIGMQPIHDPVRITDSLYIIPGDGLHENKEFVAFNPYEKKKVFWFGSFPQTKLKNRQDSVERTQKFFSETLPKPNGRKFLVRYYRFKTFKILNSQGNPFIKIRINNRKNQPIYLSRIRSTDQYIYQLSFNATAKEYLKNPQDFNGVIELWNWQGKQVKRFQLNKSFVWFDISDKYQKLYGIAPEVSDRIYVYDLSRILGL